MGLNVAVAVMEARDPTASIRPGPAPPPGSLSLSTSWPGAHSRFDDFFFSVHSGQSGHSWTKDGGEATQHEDSGSGEGEITRGSEFAQGPSGLGRSHHSRGAPSPMPDRKRRST